MNKMGPIPVGNMTALGGYFLKVVTDIGILSGLLAALLAAFTWMAAMSKYQLSALYPFLSINFVLVPLLSVYFFHETLNIYKIIGILVIVLGVFIFTKGI
jgi:uncharacterized membrane protein